jgi:hypothetical protein
VLETLGWGAAVGRPILAWYSASSSAWTASSWRRSKSVTGRPRQRSAADHGAVHQLQDRPLAERVGDDLEPPALLQEQPLEEIRGPERPAVGDREAQVRDAGLEVVRKACHRVRQLALIVGDQAGAQLAGDRP